MKLTNPYTKAQYNDLLVTITDEERQLVESTSTHNCCGWFYLKPEVINKLKEEYGDEEDS